LRAIVEIINRKRKSRSLQSCLVSATLSDKVRGKKKIKKARKKEKKEIRQTNMNKQNKTNKTKQNNHKHK